MYSAGGNRTRENGGEKKVRRGVKNRRENRKLRKEKGI